MIVKNTTIQNKTKQNKLSNQHIIPSHCISNPKVNDFLKSIINYTGSKQSILFSIGCELVRGNTNSHLKQFLSEYSFPIVKIENIPYDEFDLLGSIYQYLNSKRENLEKGSFYTDYKIAKDFVNDLDFNKNQLILDPACGSGSFLFNSNASPNHIFGVDNDPIAIMIAKFNYFIKFPNGEYPNIFCDDFFNWYLENKHLMFDYLIGNPPYGANLNLKNINSSHVISGESFSYFIEFGYTLLKDTGIMRYLLPESILNVKKHYDIRKYILNNTNLSTIKKYKTKFAGVMSDLYMLEITNDKINSDLIFIDNKSTKISKTIFKGLKNWVITYFNQKDITIIQKVTDIQGANLSNSIFALGVVTGNNKEKLFDNPTDNSEPIYSGKEVTKYKLLSPKKHIVFDRNNLQQVASDNVYRVSLKLVYKTISKHIKIAIDDTQSLTTNSANIIIPNINGLDIYTVMGILNSQLYSYLNIKLFGGVNKISKENLQALPFPKISTEQNLYIKQLVMNAMKTSDDSSLQNYIHENIFGLSKSEIEYIFKYNT
jgi:SAM-dependent methyltransferase